jgi:tetratricopeptide (TPR) repeat protein
MRKLRMMLVAASLLICAAMYGKTITLPGAAKTEKLERARMAEERGDLARIYSDYATAASYYQSALRVKRQNALLYDKLGIAELLLGERGLARKHFALALKYNPRYVAALNNLGVVALLDKLYKPAVSYFNQALALDETNAHVHVNLAETWIGMNETDRAMAEYIRALELDADVLSGSNEGIQAQLSTPEQRARVSYIIAKMYMKRGNIEGALEYLRRAKEGNFPDLAQVYTDSDFSPLWKDPRLAKIIKR